MIVRSAALSEQPSHDLRRRRTRAQAHALIERAGLLEPRERRLIVDLFEQGRPCSVIARELGCDARSLRREVRGITRRMLDPRFDFVAALADSWRPTRRRIAHAFYINGKSLRETARSLGVSLYSVRHHRDAVEAMFEASRMHRA